MPQRREQARHRAHMLFGEQLGRHHDRRLISVLDREQRGEQRDDRLAAADVALQQPLHATVAASCRATISRIDAYLRAGELKRQRVAQRRLSACAC